ncbi:MAG: hypothetical protein K6A32_04435 [Bacteroidales bacterium]|nr:hypothetical protein [Bacteroidales bacterium]
MTECFFLTLPYPSFTATGAGSLWWRNDVSKASQVAPAPTQVAADDGSAIALDRTQSSFTGNR